VGGPVRRRQRGTLAVVGLRYLCYDSALGAVAAWRYALVALVGHVSALACVPLVLLLVR
jgi:hypothetical protein